MWPWEHLAIGYVLYSGGTRLVARRRIDGAETVAVVLGTQFPDLIDKPLAWGLGVLPSGLSLAHSVLFAVPLCLVALAVAHHRNRGAVGIAFGVGYLSHLAGDVVYPLATDGELGFAFLLWPLVDRRTSDTRGLTGNVTYYVDQFLAFLGTPRGRVYLALELSLLVLALALLVSDRSPGNRSPRRWFSDDR